MLSNEQLEGIRRSLMMSPTLPADQGRALLEEVHRLRTELAALSEAGDSPRDRGSPS